jgi:hypothetical protein
VPSKKAKQLAQLTLTRDTRLASIEEESEDGENDMKVKMNQIANETVRFEESVLQP